MLDGSRFSSLVWTGNLELLSFDNVPKIFLYSCVDAEEQGLFSSFLTNLHLRVPAASWGSSNDTVPSQRIYLSDGKE